MPLKKMSVVTDQPAAKGGKEMPRIKVRGNVVARFNEASARYKEAEKVLEEIRPDLEETALDELFEINVSAPSRPIDSIKIEDDTTNTCRISFTSRYKIADGEAASAVFESMQVDINEHAVETAKAAFDSKVFLDKEENFNETVYNAYRDAIAAVTDKLVAEKVLPAGTKSPLSSKPVVVAKPAFHEKRWSVFNTVAKQKKVFQALPNAVQCVAGALVQKAPGQKTELAEAAAS